MPAPNSADDALIAAILAQESATAPAKLEAPDSTINSVTARLASAEQELLTDCPVSLRIEKIGGGWGMKFDPSLGLSSFCGESSQHWDAVGQTVQVLAAGHVIDLITQGINQSAVFKANLLAKTARSEVKVQNDAAQVDDPDAAAIVQRYMKKK